VAWPDAVAEEDVRSFLIALDWHGLVPYFHQLAASRLPGELRSLLRARALLHVAVEHERLVELRKVSTALHSREVRTLTVKGSALAYQIYPAAYLRPRADHDLLIDSSRIDSVRELFTSLGYTESSTGGSLITAQTTFLRDDESIPHVFDIHWRTSNVHAVSNALDAETIFASATAHPEVEHLLVPSLAHSLLVALLHRAAHHHDSDRLIWLADIDLLVRKIGAEGVVACLDDARKRQALSVCVRGLSLTSEWFDTPLPPLPEMTSDKLRWLAGRRAGRLEYFFNDFRALPTWRSRAQWIRELAFPTEDFMRTHFSERGDKSLPRLYLKRGVRGLLRIFTHSGR